MNNQLNSLIIFSLFEGKNKWIGLLIMSLIPYINILLKYIWANILKLWYRNKISVILKRKENKDGVVIDNFSYTSLCWYTISEYCDNQKSIVCEDDYIKRSEKLNNNKHRRLPNYIPNNSYNIKFNNYNIKISFSESKDSKIIIISSNNIKNIKNFITHVNNLYEIHVVDNLNPDKMYVCEWFNSRYRNTSKFIENEMKILKTYSNVYLNPTLINSIKKDIFEFKNNESFYNKNGIPFKRGYLFHGKPGTGKTSTVYAIARENNMNLYKLSKHIGTCIKFKDIVKKIPNNSIILIEEIDTQIYNDRNDSKEKDISEKNKITDKHDGKLPMSELMEVLDGYDSLHGCIIILTTNHKEYLDNALIRPGRIDMHYLFDKLDSDDIKNTVEKFTGFDIDVKKNITMTSSKLINQILLPNKNNKQNIETLVNK